LKQPWYYDTVIARPYTPPGSETPLYNAIHSGKVKMPTREEFLAAVEAAGNDGKIVLTCTTCAVTNDTTSVGNFRQGRGMSCLCGGGKDILKQPWYYDTVIARPYTPPGSETPWYNAIHSGKVKMPTREEFLAAVEAAGCKGKIVLTCPTCAVTNNTTWVDSLRGGGGMSCLCGGGKDILKQPWYYDTVIARPYTPPGSETRWYDAIHSGKVKMPTREVFLAAVEAAGNDGKIVLTCTTCAVTNDTTSGSSLQRGGGMSCLCGGWGILKQPWYFDLVIAKPYTPPGSKTPLYNAIHSGKVKMPTREDFLAAVEAAGKIVLTCTTCGVTNDTTLLRSLRGGGGMSCACTNKSQQAVLDFVCQVVAKEFPLFRVLSEVTVASLGFPDSPPHLSKCRFDIVVVESSSDATRGRGRCIVEPDGNQHFFFTTKFHDTPADVDARAAIDKDKEDVAIANGIHVARLLSNDVTTDRFDWKGYVRGFLRASLGGTSTHPRVWTPDGAVEYTRADSAYAKAHSANPPAAAATV
jgi:hypothetical protein